ncbi:MAG TPA: Pvc16 family protein [Burkholderiales bacterium]|nr:Pvc16 family protein [Burkholderiales bacterium]
MALADTKEAIGAVTQMLQTKLIATTGVNVTIGRPEAAAKSSVDGPKLNLFLYQVGFDPFMKNMALDDGQPMPLWAVLHYFVTAFDSGKDSDTIDAHKLLGRGVTALQTLNYMEPNPASIADAPLIDNPEPLKLTFDNADVELLSKVMQGSDESYRVSAAFQVRPVMLFTDGAPQYAPVVLSVGPPSSPGIIALPSLGPHLDELDPVRFEAGATLALTGTDLGTVSEVCLGDTCYPASFADGELSVTIPAATLLSARSYGVTAVKVLPSGRRFSSNAVLGRLLPTLTTATHGALTPTGTGALHGTLNLTGARLGGLNDSIFVALYRDGVCAVMLEPTGIAAQNALSVTLTPEQALDPGTYYVILRVNGEQAIASPAVNWT